MYMFMYCDVSKIVQMVWNLDNMDKMNNICKKMYLFIEMVLHSFINRRYIN